MMLYNISDFGGCIPCLILVFGQLFLAESTNEAASVTRISCLLRTSVLMAHFTVAPTPSTAPLPWLKSRKSQCWKKVLECVSSFPGFFLSGLPKLENGFQSLKDARGQLIELYYFFYLTSVCRGIGRSNIKNSSTVAVAVAVDWSSLKGRYKKIHSYK